MALTKKVLIGTLSVFILITVNTKLAAQGNLRKLINIEPEKQICLGALLEQISYKQNFSFAYNNSIIPADSLVKVSGYRGTIISLLEKLLGDNYEYKEVPGYVVLRYAPGRLSITAHLDREAGKQMLIKGYVNNVADKKAIGRASVYEENLLVSTLTNDKGYFELRIKNWTGPLSLTVKKENFRDTSLHLLADVIVTDKHDKQNYNYYPEEGPAGVEHSRFARFFISSKQLVQSLNIGNFFASSPYQISFTPGLSSQGLYNSQVIDHFSINLLGGYTAGINGFEAGGLFNINRRDVQYFQAAGVFNFVGGNVKGVQLAGIYNKVVNNVAGLQAAGFANKTQDFTGGLQLAGLVNLNEKANGLAHVAGVANVYTESKGLTMAGLGNLAKTSSAFQIAGLFNIGGKRSNIQFTSMLNAAGKVTGTQIGLINIADTSDFPIGIINLIKTGEKSIALSTNETLFTQLDFRSGGRVLYSILGIGYRFGQDAARYQLNLGIGAHIINGSRFYLNTELTGNSITDFKHTSYQRTSLKALPGFKLYNHIWLFAGPTLNQSSADAGVHIPASGWLLPSNTQNTNTLSLGLSGGLQYVWGGK